MATKGIEHFPEPEDWTDEYLKALGYRRCSVSIFDHWLTREEWDLNPLVSLERARANGLEATYHEQNRRFRQFYRRLFDKGVYRVTGLRSKPQVVWHSGWDRRLKKAVTAVVEDKTFGNEFYAPAYRVRVSSNDARTDNMLFEDGADEGAIESLAFSHGLSLIR